MMRKINSKLMFLLVIGIFLLAPLISYAKTKIAVIVNPKRPEVFLPLEKIAAIYQGKLTRWTDGVRMIVLNQQADSKVRENFYYHLYKKPPNEKFFTKKGTVFRSVQLSSSAKIKHTVASMLDAIGYVESSYVDKTIKVVHEFEAADLWERK